MRSPIRWNRPPFFWLWAALVAGCSGGAEPKGPNRACFRALDCQSGLVCVEGRCTADITPIVPAGSGAAPAPPVPEPGGPDAGD